MRALPVLCLTALSAAALSLASATALAVPTISDMGTAPGSIFTYSTGVNQNGSAACGYDDINTRAYRWVSPGTHQALGLAPGSALWSYGQAISADGTTVVGWGDGPGGQRAWRWNGGMSTYSPLPGGDSCAAFAVNSNGTVIAGQSNGSGFGQRAAVWYVSGPTISLGVLPGGTTSFAYGIDNTGNVVVGNSTSASGTRAFRWVSPGPMQDLGVLPAQSASGATAISGNGQVVVGGSGTRAFRWFAPAGPMQDIGAFNAYAVNGDGSAVVGNGGGGAVIWTPNAGIRSLSTWLPTLGVNLAGWTLSDCRGISADGTTIVGNGTFGGTPKAFIVRGLPCLDSPAVTQNPPATLSTCSFSNSVLTVNGSSAATAISFQWRRNGVPIGNGPTGNGSTRTGATSTQLTIISSQPADAGLYDCVMTNTCGSSTTTACALSVGGEPVNPFAPLTTSHCSYSTVSISAGYTSGLPIGYTWYKGFTPLANGPTGNGSTISGVGTGTITITSIQPADAGTYYCEAATICGAAEGVFTRTLQVGGEPVNTIPESTSNICPGGTLSITQGYVATLPIGYTWYKGFTPLVNGPTGNGSTISGVGTGTITISNIQPADAGSYSCEAATICGGGEGIFVRHVVVGSFSGVTLTPVSPIDCSPGPVGFFATVASPSGPLGYFWLFEDGPGNWVNIFDGQFVGTGNSPTFTVNGTGTGALTITNVIAYTGNNVLRFQCIVTGTCSMLSSNIGALTITTTRCSPADIAYGDGEPLPPIGECGGFNPVGPDGGDFDCFFNAYFAPSPLNAVCDIAYGDGEPLPPFGLPGGFNPGVDGGDFDCFFNYYFTGCL